MDTEIRWKRRFDNYSKVFLELQEAVDLARARPLSKLEKQGTIQGFEYTHGLAWNFLKDYLEYRGIVGLIGSRTAAVPPSARSLPAIHRSKRPCFQGGCHRQASQRRLPPGRPAVATPARSAQPIEAGHMSRQRPLGPCRP